MNSATILSLPAPGTIVQVVPVGADQDPSQWWEAKILSYLPNGQLRVLSTREGASTAQNVSKVAVA